MAAKKRIKSKSARSEAKAAIGIIGGSGLYSMNGLTDTREIRAKTPFGDPSDAIVLGTLEGKRVAFLARHGRGHRILPGEINYRANIYAMKLLGVQRIISVSAVGSLLEDLRPGEFLVPDQFFDRTKNRVSTFFGDGLVAHVAFAHPTCGQLSGVLPMPASIKA
jgi:5'-methylthioadenosine phosphorylase